jgi:hypothetical protein
MLSQTTIMLAPTQVDSLTGQILSGRALIDVDGVKVDLGTLGGANSWMMWGDINDLGQVVGFSETAAPDPNGEDVCLFGTHRTCRPFLWQPSRMSARPVLGKMSALPTLGGNNGQASAINGRGQIVGFAEDGTVDPTCQANTTNNMSSTPYHGGIIPPPCSLISKLALSPMASTTEAKLPGQSAVPTAKRSLARFGGIACSQASTFCREMLAA